MRHPFLLFGLAVACIAAWIVLTFALDLRSGWTHVPLVGGVLLVVGGIVAADERRADT